MSKAFGVQFPTQGEDAVSWQTWSDGAGGLPDIVGDVDYGKLKLDLTGQEGRSAVYDLGAYQTCAVEKTIVTGDTYAKLMYVGLAGLDLAA